MFLILEIYIVFCLGILLVDYFWIFVYLVIFFMGFRGYDGVILELGYKK